MAACSELPSSCLRWLVGEMHAAGGGDLSGVPFIERQVVGVVRQRPSGFVNTEMVKKCKVRRRGAERGAGSRGAGAGGGWRGESERKGI